jgi:hypothetical protein
VGNGTASGVVGNWKYHEWRCRWEVSEAVLAAHVLEEVVGGALGLEGVGREGVDEVQLALPHPIGQRVPDLLLLLLALPDSLLAVTAVAVHQTGNAIVFGKRHQDYALFFYLVMPDGQLWLLLWLGLWLGLMTVGQYTQSLLVFEGNGMRIEEAIDIEVVLIRSLHILIRTPSPSLLLLPVPFLLSVIHTLSL